MKKYIYAFTAAVLAASCPVKAQDLDPTVVVSRTYEGQLMEVHKPSFYMEVPDSVSRFDLDFDYSVFDKPYKGAYEFNPYVLTMRPASAVQAPKQLYLNAGAGYTLHPTFDLIWTPAFKGAFRMDVYARHRSYVGDYRKFIPSEESAGKIALDRWVRSGGDHSYWNGYDLDTRAGMDGSYDWFAGTVDFDVAYQGLAVKDDCKERMYDAVDVAVDVSSKSDGETYFQYDVQADYRFGKDKMERFGTDSSIGEHVFGMDATVGQVIRNKHNVSFDVNLNLVSYSHPSYASSFGDFNLVPHYVLGGKRWTVNAGIRMSKIFRSEMPEHLYPTTEQFVYPDISAWYDLIPDAMRMYAYIGGGNRLDTYSSILEKNHHFDLTYGHGLWPVMDVTVERVSASIGFKGRAGSRFTYDLRAGYVNYKNGMLDAVLINSIYDVEGPQYLPGMGYSAYRKFYSALDMGFRNENLKFDGSVLYTYAWGLKNASGLFAPAAVAGDFAFEYNWSRRIYVGADCAFSSRRKGSIVNLLDDKAVMDAYIPGYVDLGVYSEVAVTRMLSFWIRGGNLLNMTIQHNPLYAEKGVNFTVGICLNL